MTPDQQPPDLDTHPPHHAQGPKYFVRGERSSKLQEDLEVPFDLFLELNFNVWHLFLFFLNLLEALSDTFLWTL